MISRLTMTATRAASIETTRHTWTRTGEHSVVCEEAT